MTLEEIAIACGTDKVPFGYLPIYEAFFSKFPEEGSGLLEIGVQKGYSMAMWKAWRPLWRVYGVDIDPASPADFFGDQSDGGFMGRVGEATKPDIIVDDGGHKGSYQVITLKALWPHLAPGGLYCVEDLHTAYSSAWGCEFRDWLETTVDTVNGKGDPSMNIRSVHLWKSLAIIQKV